MHCQACVAASLLSPLGSGHLLPGLRGPWGRHRQKDPAGSRPCPLCAENRAAWGSVGLGALLLRRPCLLCRSPSLGLSVPPVSALPRAELYFSSGFCGADPSSGPSRTLPSARGPPLPRPPTLPPSGVGSGAPGSPRSGPERGDPHHRGVRGLPGAHGRPGPRAHPLAAPPRLGGRRAPGGLQ